MNIHQLSLTYDPMEDRILWRVNTTTREEIQIWLTRRMTVNLMPHLPKVAAEQIALSAPVETPLLNERDKQVFAEFKAQEHLSRSDFSTPYVEGHQNLLSEGPLVLTDMQMRVQSDGLTLLILQERGRRQQTGRALELRLKPHLIQGLMHLLKEIWPQTGWAESPSDLSTGAQSITELPTSHKGLLN